jgi:hypothetical protein
LGINPAVDVMAQPIVKLIIRVVAFLIMNLILVFNVKVIGLQNAIGVKAQDMKDKSDTLNQLYN